MKKLILTTIMTLSMASSVFASEIQNVHDQYIQSEAGETTSQIHGHAMTMSEMNDHQRAEVVHESMNNGHSFAHQNMKNDHEKMAGTTPEKPTQHEEFFASMNEHEQAAVAHEFTRNGQSGPNKLTAEKHREMESAG